MGEGIGERTHGQGKTMRNYTMLPMKNSIATRLLKVVFSLYLIIAVGITLFHMFLEYRYQKESIHKDLEDIQQTFEQGLALDLWQMDQPSLQSTIKGMLKIPIIVGVKIQNPKNLDVAVGGIIRQENVVGAVGLHVDLLGLNQIESSVHENEKYNLELFMHRFPIIYSYDNETNQLGTATVYSNTSVILKRLKLGFLLLIINAVIKTAALWMIFLWFSHRLLRKPLEALATATQKINLDNLASSKIKIETSGKNELAVIESSFNSMIENLYSSVSKHKKEEERYRKTIESSLDGFWIVDIQGNLIEVNDAYISMTGYSRNELLKMSIMDVEVVEQAEETKKRIEKIIQYGSDRFESRHRHKEGRSIDVEVSTTYTQDSGGLFFVFIRDITDRNKMEERLRQAQKMESIGNLAGGIAHDFNNLLFPIIGMSEMLLEDLPENSLEYENTKEILHAGKRAGDLVNQILTFSRQSEHKMIPVRVQNVLKEVLKLSRSTIPANIEIHQDIQQDCGLVMADPTQIHQIAMNLITNASHAVENKNGVMDIKLKELSLKNNDLSASELQPGPYINLLVADNGVGMYQNTINKIFEPYFTTKEKGKGTGLGLAVVHGIVKEHGGDIKVYSEVGKGTTFNVYLPLMKKTSEIIRLDKISETAVGTENILLVDDEASVAKLEGQMLSRLGYQVIVKTSSGDALNTFKSKPGFFDLVISDMTMPDMTGDQLSKELLSIQPNLPIIICTGFSERINKEQAETIGVTGFLMKPVSKAEMAQLVRQILDQRPKGK